MSLSWSTTLSSPSIVSFFELLVLCMCMLYYCAFNFSFLVNNDVDYFYVFFCHLSIFLYELLKTVLHSFAQYVIAERGRRLKTGKYFCAYIVMSQSSIPLNYNYVPGLSNLCSYKKIKCSL